METTQNLSLALATAAALVVSVAGGDAPVVYPAAVASQVALLLPFYSLAPMWPAALASAVVVTSTYTAVADVVAACVVVWHATAAGGMHT